MSEGSSYRQILRSSSIMGGAQGINYLVSLLRVKVVAVLLGPGGVGIIGLYMSVTGLLGAVTSMGLSGSAVRAIARAEGQSDPMAVARSIRMLRRLCWVTGVLGWVATAALAVPLSQWLFKSNQHAWALALLGSSLLISSISNGQQALLQGLRRIGDVARVQVAAALVNGVVTIALYAVLRERGIVPVLVANAVVTLAFSWWFARQIDVPQVVMGWRDAVAEARPMLALGAAMMWSGVLSLLLDLFTRTLISRQFGMESAGLYQAAWTLSGMFAGFVLGAMGTDFYPRLTAVIHDRRSAIRAVNEQTEIGILLALPGLLATLALAKWVIWILYSSAFAPAADILAWMVVGVFGRVLSWPLGYIQLALGAGRWFFATEVTFLAIQAALVSWLVPQHGPLGAAYAFAGCYVLYTVGMAWVGHRLIGFRWSADVVRTISVSMTLGLTALVANRLLPEFYAEIAGAVVALGGCIYCLRGLVRRTGPDHMIGKLVNKVPGARYLFIEKRARE